MKTKPTIAYAQGGLFFPIPHALRSVPASHKKLARHFDPPNCLSKLSDPENISLPVETCAIELKVRPLVAWSIAPATLTLQEKI